MNKPESSEFRSVHASKDVLERYIKSNRNIKIIQSIPFNTIERYDVWKSVFENESCAHRELQIKELYSILENKSDSPSPEMTATLCVILLTNIVEFKNSPLNLSDAIEIIIDTLGKKFIPHLKREAKVSYDRRVEITKPYFKTDYKWINYSKIVVDALNLV